MDDDSGILKSFKEILEAEGYSVDTAQTGVDALEKCRARSYNLAIIDVKLGDIDGTELLVRVHQMLPRTRKIIITGYPSLENAVESVNQQADAYVIKPVHPDEFLKIVADNMNKQMEAESETEKKVMGWIETRYEETKRNRSQRKPRVPEQLKA